MGLTDAEKVRPERISKVSDDGTTGDGRDGTVMLATAGIPSSRHPAAVQPRESRRFQSSWAENSPNRASMSLADHSRKIQPDTRWTLPATK